MNTNYACSPTAEVAKLIRRALGEKFPGVKFSVRSSNYSMGSSIRINWTDGPTTEKVKTVAQKFETVHRDQWGEILSGGNRFVFCDRDISPELEGFVREHMAKHYDLTGMMEYEVERLYRELCEKLDRPVSSKGKSETAQPKIEEQPDEQSESVVATLGRVGAWTWLTFAEKPAASIISALSADGWRWSHKRSAWYNFDGKMPPACVSYTESRG